MILAPLIKEKMLISRMRGSYEDYKRRGCEKVTKTTNAADARKLLRKMSFCVNARRDRAETCQCILD
jgi:hypothetical protein